MKKGAVPLGAVAALATHLEVACTRCERRGRYRLARLVVTYGSDFPMTDLGTAITDCTRRTATAVQDRCDIYFPDLPKIMHGDQPPRPHSSDTDDD
jgi:hypothetical protein